MDASFLRLSSLSTRRPGIVPHRPKSADNAPNKIILRQVSRAGTCVGPSSDDNLKAATRATKEKKCQKDPLFHQSKIGDTRCYRRDERYVHLKINIILLQRTSKANTVRVETHLRRADAVTGHVEDVVHPSSDPVEPIRVTVAAVSGEVIALDLRDKRKGGKTKGDRAVHQYGCQWRSSVRGATERWKPPTPSRRESQPLECFPFPHTPLVLQARDHLTIIQPNTVAINHKQL